MQMKGYYFITDTGLSKAGSISDVRAAEAAGVQVVQYRNKDASTKVLFEEAQALRVLCRKTRLLINDRIDIALAVNADGVHIGQDDMPYNMARQLLGKNRIIGVTVHTVEEARFAEQQGADYVGVSPIFGTATKLDAGKPAGIVLVEAVRRAVKIPIVAIGGITLENAPRVIAAGADSVCAISAVVTKANVTDAIKSFQKLF
jgi:thiamine-phosphate pyrophosphorylase